MLDRQYYKYWFSDVSMRYKKVVILLSLVIIFVSLLSFNWKKIGMTQTSNIQVTMEQELIKNVHLDLAYIPYLQLFLDLSLINLIN